MKLLSAAQRGTTCRLDVAGEPGTRDLALVDAQVESVGA
jgi:hypothetical protein